MTTFQIHSIKTLGYIILSIVLLSLHACKEQENKTKAADEEPTANESSVQAPSVDIHTAAFFGNLDAIKQHIHAGSDLNQKDQYGSTPLNIATTFGKTDIALELIKAGADLNIKNGEGSTPLHVASFFCRKEIVKALLENGADKSLTNHFGATPLMSVSAPFREVKPFYEQMSKNLGSFGLKLDYDYIEKTRPIIADMLQ